MKRQWENKCILLNEANLNRLHIAWFQLYDILQKAKLYKQ